MKKSDLTSDQQDRIHYAVQKGFGIQDWEPISVLSGASEAFVYKININKIPYVIKLDNINDKKFDLVRCYALLENVSKQGIAPPVYFTDAAHGVVLMKYIDAKPRPQGTVESIKQFAGFIRKLHDGPSFSPWRSIYQILDYLYQQLTPDYQQSGFIQNCIQQALELKSVLSDPADIRPCHGDLNPYNVLFDGNKFYLVDWATASPQSFYFDLACCANFFYFYSDELCQKFLTEYFNRLPSCDENRKFLLMRKFTNVYYGIMFIFMSLQANVKLSPLSESDIALLPGYPEFMQSIGAGKVNLADPKTQQKFGYIFLKAAAGKM